MFFEPTIPSIYVKKTRKQPKYAKQPKYVQQPYKPSPAVTALMTGYKKTKYKQEPIIPLPSKRQRLSLLDEPKKYKIDGLMKQLEK